MVLHWKYSAFSQEVLNWCYIGNTVRLARGLIMVVHWQYGAFSQEV